MLTREAILKASDATMKEIQVPEWGGSVFVRSMSAYERDAFEAEQFRLNEAGRRAENARARMAAACVCDAEGGALFTAEDVEELGKKSAKALSRIFDAALALNGFTADDVEELEKN